MSIAELSDGRIICFYLRVVSENEDSTQFAIEIEGATSVPLKATCLLRAYHEAIEKLEEHSGAQVLHVALRPKKKTIPPEAA